jgi:hypothetical protein
MVFMGANFMMMDFILPVVKSFAPEVDEAQLTLLVQQVSDALDNGEFAQLAEVVEQADMPESMAGMKETVLAELHNMERIKKTGSLAG